MLSGAIVAASVWACKATTNPDGSVTVEVTPEHTITARGLEQALKLLNELMADCVSGAIPCSPSDVAEIGKAIDRVASRKGRILETGTRAPLGLTPTG
jgi:hypothetical protein